MRLHEARKDLYRRLAREQGFKSRAAFKLIEANEKYDFIRDGEKVVDFGAAPGGWLQVSSRLVGESGLVVGLDLSDIHLREKNVKTVRMDVHNPKAADAILAITGSQVPVVLSDLAPTVSGIWEIDHTKQIDMTLRVIELSGTLLQPGGSSFFKLFEGERSREAREVFKARYRDVRPVKPKASRSVAAELYYFCDGWKGPLEPPMPV